MTEPDNDNGKDRGWVVRYLDRSFSDHHQLHELLREHQRELADGVEGERKELRRMDDKQREGQNEWRSTMNDRERTFLTKAEHQGLVDKVDALSMMQGAFATKADIAGLTKTVADQGTAQSIDAGRRQMITFLLAGIPTVVSIAAFLYAVTQK
jgi:hypothetical protein